MSRQATYQHLYFSDFQYAPVEAPGSPLVVCGIAQPDYLADYVQRHFPNASMMTFPDHHAYSEKDIQTIIDRARHYDCVLTTEKDAQRLRLTTLPQQLEQAGKPLMVLPIEVRLIHDAEGFARQLLTYVRENAKTRK